MGGPARRGPARRTITLVVISIALLGGTACDRTQPQAADDTPSPQATAPPSPCPAPALEPGYLPEGVEKTERDPLFALPERTRTWEDDDVLVQLLEGFSADHGDEPSVEKTSVRDDGFANMSSQKTDDGEVMLVDWSEDTRCGRKQYAIVTMELSEKETLKIARSLEEGGSDR